MGGGISCRLYFDLMLAICILITILALLLVSVLFASRASTRRKNKDKGAGCQPSQANSCSSMATSSLQEDKPTRTSGRQLLSPGAEGKQSSPTGESEGEGWTVVRGGTFSHPIYKRLSSLSGELNGLPLSKVKEKLSALNLSSMYVYGTAALVFDLLSCLIGYGIYGTLYIGLNCTSTLLNDLWGTCSLVPRLFQTLFLYVTKSVWA